MRVPEIDEDEDDEILPGYDAEEAKRLLSPDNIPKPAPRKGRIRPLPPHYDKNPLPIAELEREIAEEARRRKFGTPEETDKEMLAFGEKIRESLKKEDPWASEDEDLMSLLGPRQKDPQKTE